MAAAGAYQAKGETGSQQFDATGASSAFATAILEEHGKEHDYDDVEGVQFIYLMAQDKQIGVMWGQEAAEAKGRMLGCVLCSDDGEICACTPLCMGAGSKKAGQTYLEHLCDGHNTRRSDCEGCLRGLMRAKRALRGALGDRRHVTANLDTVTFTARDNNWNLYGMSMVMVDTMLGYTQQKCRGLPLGATHSKR